MHSLKRALAQFIRSLVNPRSIHRLKLNTLLRLTFILLLGGAGLTACANLQTVSFAERMKTRAEQGDALGQVGLGLMYKKGRGVPQDDQLAVQWFRKAAEQGLAGSQHNLGWMYKKGRGVPQDDRLAVEWFRKAAEQGDGGSQVDLGFMYQEGRGVPKNYVYAYMWINIASFEAAFEQRPLNALQKTLEEEMTPSQIQKAKELTRACIRKQYKDCEV